MVEGKKRTIFAVLNHEAGRGPARLRRLVWDQEIAGSNPAAPTTKAAHNVSGFFVRESESSLSSERRKVLPPRLFVREDKNLVQNETFFHHVPLRQANMVLMVGSEPHR